MNLDELQSVRDRERQTDKLQQLRESFYADAGEFIQQLRTERERAAERADDPFDAPEVNQLTDEINTAEQTVEAIYEKRVGKIVKAASFAAADLPAEADGMTAEEQALFDTLVGDIKDNRERVLDVLAGEDSPQQSPHRSGPSTQSQQPNPSQEQPEPATDTAPPTDVSAADAMGDAPTADADTPAPESPTPDKLHEEPPIPDDSSDGSEVGDETVTIGEDGSTGDGSDVPTSNPPVRNDGGTEGTAATETPRQPADVEQVERRTVRITADVDTFVGFDDREYDLGEHDVVTLPATNVGPLVKRGVAEHLE